MGFNALEFNSLRPSRTVQLSDAAVPGLALRPQTAADGKFLECLYISNRWRELESTGWPETQKTAFLRSQFSLQTRHYDAEYKGSLRWIVTRENAGIGRLCLMPMDGDIRIVDIALLPEHHGKGIGTILLEWVRSTARRHAGTVSLHVLDGNPAIGLYRRLGFEAVGARIGAHRFMLWSAS